MAEPIIHVEDVSKRYLIGARQSHDSIRDAIGGLLKFNSRTGQSEEFWALRDVNFDIYPGDRLGIIGRNGAGKSTLLKIISRITPPTSGKIRMNGRAAALLEVGTGFNPELTGRENIFLNGAILGMTRREIRSKFDQIVDFSEISQFLDTPVKRYSSGMYVRLAFAIAAHLEPEILIVDEVLAVGDIQFQKKCLGKMSSVGREGRTVIFVSHNMGAISSLCNKGLCVESGRTQGIQTIEDAITHYIGREDKNEATFKDKPLSRIAIKQSGQVITIDAYYAMDQAVKVPNFGFVISDQYGSPICGTNPLIDQPKKEWHPQKQGKVQVDVEYPKLMDGSYSLSVWFGDDKETFFSAQDCLRFEVINMISRKQLPTSDVGHVYPICKWHFE